MEKALSRPARSTPVLSAASGRRLDLIDDIGKIIEQPADVVTMLNQIVDLVADRLDMEVCSIYSFAPETNRLTLVATRGLDPASVGR